VTVVFDFHPVQCQFLVICLVSVFNVLGCEVDAPEVILDNSHSDAKTNDNIHDFGIVRPGQELEHTFTHTNKTNRKLEIDYVKTSCGCTSAKCSTYSLEPGDSTNLTVVFQPRSTTAPSVQSATIVCKNTDEVYPYFVRAQVRPNMVITPQPIDVSILSSTKTSIPLRINNYSSREWAQVKFSYQQLDPISPVINNTAFFVLPEKQSDTLQAWFGELTVDASNVPPGRYRVRCRVSSTGPEPADSVEFVMPCTVLSPIVSTPPALVFSLKDTSTHVQNVRIAAPSDASLLDNLETASSDTAHLSLVEVLEHQDALSKTFTISLLNTLDLTEGPVLPRRCHLSLKKRDASRLQHDLLSIPMVIVP
jgi:hypothetical protein